MSNTEEIEIPHYFICPISLQMMKDPVIVPTGITYDRENIEKWVFSNNNQFCPVTKQSLPAESIHDLITPNHTLRRLIQSWCALNASNGIERFPTPKPAVTKSQITKLINDHSKSTTQAKINCLAKLKSIAAVSHANKRCIEAAGGALFAASLISDATDDALSTLHSLNLSESGLKTLFTSEGFLNALTSAMKLGSYDSRAYSVMILKSITEITDPTDTIIMGSSLNPSFFAEIVQLIKDQITPKATRAGLHVLINVTSNGRNRVKAVEAGAVQVIIDMLVESSEKRVCEMALTVLDQLCQCAEGRAEVLGHGAGLAIVSKKIMRVSKVGSERGIRVLHSIAKHSGSAVVLKEMLEVGVVSKLCLVLQVEMQGMKIKERVVDILKMHARTWKNAHCIPMPLLSSYPN